MSRLRQPTQRIGWLLFALVGLGGVAFTMTAPRSAPAEQPPLQRRTQTPAKKSKRSPQQGTHLALPPLKPKREVLSTPPRKWTWVKIPESRCGYGTTTGMALNPSPGAKTLIIMLQGGGACWKRYGALGGCFSRIKFVFSLRGINKKTFRRSWRIRRILRTFVLQRNRSYNPFANAHYAFLPYCTGDLHAGNSTLSFRKDQTIRFHGHRNMKAFLARLVPTFPKVKRVILAGVSAGAVGAFLNWQLVQKAFGPKVRVDLLNDSGLPLKPDNKRWNQWLSAWNLRLPEGCKQCKDSMDHLIGHYRTTMFRRGRKAAFISFRRDRIIRTFLGMFTQSLRFQRQMYSMLDKIHQDKNAHYFIQPGYNHVVLFRHKAHRIRSPRRVTLETWMKQFANDDPAWSSHRPPAM